MDKSIAFVKDDLLGGLECRIRLARNQETYASPGEIETRPDGAVVHMVCGKDGKEGAMDVALRTDGTSVVVSVESKLKKTTGKAWVYAPEAGVSFALSLEGLDDVLGSHHDNRWWMYPQFCHTLRELERETQGVLVRRKDAYLYLLPLNGDNFRCEIDHGMISLSVGCDGRNALSGAFLCVSQSRDPFEAITAAFRYARSVGALRVALREERSWPEALKGFGFCTWNAFYQDITADKTYEKLRELKEKGIPVQWVLLDDGWSCRRNSMLTAFEADPEKFPEGLAACVRRIKEEFGIPRVGVWHTFNGYWNGVDPESELFRRQRENLDLLPTGMVLPAADEEKAFAFYDAWHSYLRDCGVDFVKVDNQSTYQLICEGTAPTTERTRAAHRALERSVFKNFGGAIINCMGMDMENVLERPLTAIDRNSDDFYPDREGSFAKHLVQNAWNALWHDQLYICDYDMWWSQHESALQSGVLRAVSGGPVYVSDAVGGTSAAAIRPCVLADGSLPVMDHAALPTRDILFTDCLSTGRFVKVWNAAGDNRALAVFNFGEEHTEEIRLSDIPGIDPKGEYLAVERISGTTRRLFGRESFPLTLRTDGCAALSLLPVRNGEVEWGDGLLYFPCADPGRRRVPAADPERK